MIIDCFPFFNELDLLEARLEELSPVVDRFVIVEATRTHSGRPRELIFPQHRGRYAKFSDRIEYLPMTTFDGIASGDSWAMENGQKQVGLDAALGMMRPGDCLIYTDCDEIPRAEAVAQFASSDLPAATLEMGLHYYYVNLLCTSKRWRMAKIIRWDGSALRHRQIRRRRHATIPDAGWHFSYLSDIKEKIDSFAHTEYARPPWNTPEHIEAAVRERRDLFGRPMHYEVVSDPGYLPRHMRENMGTYGRYVCEDLSRAG